MIALDDLERVLKVTGHRRPRGRIQALGPQVGDGLLMSCRARVIVEDLLISAGVDPRDETLRRLRAMSGRNAYGNVASKFVDLLPLHVAIQLHAAVGRQAAKPNKANSQADSRLGLFEAHPLLAAFLPEPGQRVVRSIRNHADRKCAGDYGYEDQKAPLDHLNSPWSELPNNNPQSEHRSTTINRGVKHRRLSLKSILRRRTSGGKTVRCIKGGWSELLLHGSRPVVPPYVEKYINWSFRCQF